MTARLQTIRTAVTRASTLMDTLLLAERAELDGNTGDLIDPARLIRDIIRVLGDKYDGRRILSTLPADTAPETETPEGGAPERGAPERGPPENRLMLRGDREMLAVAVSNLLDNALKFSGPDQTVEITLRREDMIRISVRDRGIGFPPEQIGQVGQRFFRAANASPVPGTGLGMSIVKTVITRHHGHLTLRNRRNGGAEVTLHLPPAV